jgi:hypothetical protein
LPVAPVSSETMISGDKRFLGSDPAITSGLPVIRPD